MKVGDYVRTPQGIIAKIINIQENTEQYFLNGNAVSLESKNYIADKNITIGENFNHNPSITDLIEVGDYVNGEKVIRIFNPTFLSMGELPYVITDKSKYEPQEIKSIVTKEQFESMEYRIGE